MEKPWESKDWFVSHYNYTEDILNNSEAPEKVIVHDTTLRDGEQQPDVTFDKQDKIVISQLLDEAGVDRIEAGMPIVSKEDKEAIKEIAKLGLDADIFTFGRCLKRDVDLALDVDVSNIVMELPSSKHIIDRAYGWDVEEALNKAAEAVSYAKEHGMYVTFFTIDSTRSNWEFFEEVIKNVEKDMDSLTLADTFGACGPFATMEIVRKVRGAIDVPVEIHPHNDLGLGTANCLAAVYAGAEAVHVTVNGLGERCGNASLEEVVLALKLFHGIDTNMNLEKIQDLSDAVANRSGIPMTPQKAVVGKNPFRIESGIIADWWYHVRDEYPVEMFPYKWSLVGKENPEIVIGKMSGGPTIKAKLGDMGIDDYSEEELMKILELVKERSVMKKRPLSERQFKEVVDNVLG